MLYHREAEVPEASIDEDDVETKFNLTNYDDEDDGNLLSALLYICCFILLLL